MKISDLFLNNSDAHWERYGKCDPYFGVLNDDQFKSANIDEGAKTRFFASGQKHIAGVLDNAREHLDPDFSPANALDFGCGVGRLLIPLSSVVDAVTGIDISPSMREEARANCTEREAANVQLAGDLDELALID